MTTWTFERPVDRLAPDARLRVRMPCPGRLLWRIDDGPSEDATLQPVGDAYEVVLGPFPKDARELVFRNFCVRCTCPPGSACCEALERRVRLEDP